MRFNSAFEGLMQARKEGLKGSDDWNIKWKYWDGKAGKYAQSTNYISKYSEVGQKRVRVKGQRK